ncbi:MAG TPA: hypothetical protein VIJ19_03480 [Opitutaceae bacterium]
MHLPHLIQRLARVALVGAAMILVLGARISAASFADSLSSDQRSAIGISKLSSSQEAILDALVAQDVTLAHEGGVTGFSSSFSERHWDRERLAAGLDRLTPQERAVLDRLAATAIAIGPPPEAAFTYSPPHTSQPPPPPAAVIAPPMKAEVHGDVSFTVGAGSHGSSFYGTSADFYVTDPTGRFTVGVGFDDYRGKGLLGLCAADGLLYPPLAGW